MNINKIMENDLLTQEQKTRLCEHFAQINVLKLLRKEAAEWMNSNNEWTARMSAREVVAIDKRIIDMSVQFRSEKND